MAGTIVSQALVSSFIQVVFDKFASPKFVNFIRGKKLHKKLIKRLDTNLYAVQAVLNDAEQRQINDLAVKKWLDDLKDAVYDADDLLDRVSTEAGTTQKEVSTLFSRFLNFRESEVVTKLEDITERLEYTEKSKDILGLKENVRESMLWRTPSTSLFERSTIYGRDQDKETIMKLLLDDTIDAKISVIPIVGMDEIGKSTLAQLPLQHGVKGSKILVTTRSEKVASIVQTCLSYHLSQLDDADCWLLFANHSCLPLELGEDSSTSMTSKDRKEWNEEANSESDLGVELFGSSHMRRGRGVMDQSRGRGRGMVSIGTPGTSQLSSSTPTTLVTSQAMGAPDQPFIMVPNTNYEAPSTLMTPLLSAQ
ncbi:hypothetical protein Ahy_B06g083709 [Arachis hypogaea]|uniref:Rx N-terminal domain-containing protein n=1 Tax=Arachis hypogaea TaxID=3818 RepID=A0A444YQE5_ARAHY|nr:hypothetical protein Ahy_B06g083709 [Arachis hypogaea]